MEIAIDIIRAYGHPNVKALHKTTLEITKDHYLTPRGDCIIGVKADKAARDLNPMLKKLISKEKSLIYIILACCGVYDVIVAKGSRKLSLGNTRKIIIRKSSFICDATIGIRASKAAADLSRKLIENLRRGGVLTVIIIGVGKASL